MSARSGHSGFKKLPQVPCVFQDVEDWDRGGAWGGQDEDGMGTRAEEPQKCLGRGRC